MYVCESACACKSSINVYRRTCLFNFIIFYLYWNVCNKFYMWICVTPMLLETTGTLLQQFDSPSGCHLEILMLWWVSRTPDGSKYMRRFNFLWDHWLPDDQHVFQILGWLVDISPLRIFPYQGLSYPEHPWTSGLSFSQLWIIGGCDGYTLVRVGAMYIRLVVQGPPIGCPSGKLFGWNISKPCC